MFCIGSGFHTLRVGQGSVFSGVTEGKTYPNDSFHHVSEFSHVSRPRIIPQSRPGLRSNPAEFPAVLLVKESDEMLGEGHDVIHSFAQWWNAKTHHIQPEKEIPSELALFHSPLQVSTGDRDDSG